ncbi:MAG TPA: sugar ABC transporter permease [Anaerolineae bacterium]
MAHRAIAGESRARPAAHGGGRPQLLDRMRRYKWGYIFVLPWVLLYLAFGLYPLLLSFYLTFFTYSFTQAGNLAFVGIGNWVHGITDPLFWQGLFNITYNQVIFIALKNGFGLLTALLLVRALKGGRFFRTIYFMPVVVSVVVLMTIGIYLVGPAGPVQNLLMRLGVLRTGIFWTASRWLPMPIIALINSWKWFGVSTVIFLAGLLAIDPGLYEAAALDGSNGWTDFVYITLPQLGAQIFFLLVVDVINGLQMFTEVFTVFDLTGGPQHQALTPVLYLYDQAFGQSNIGYASALGLLLAIVIAILTLLQFRFLGGVQQE